MNPPRPSSTASNPAEPSVVIRGLITEHAVQGQGRATALLRAMMVKFSGKEWRTSPVRLEELGAVFDYTGLPRTPL